MEGRRGSWQPPERPDWVDTINRNAQAMDIRSVVPLDEASLIAAACQKTGLSHFGSDEWREPFRIFVRALEEEANLNFMGRVFTRNDIVMFLAARLEVEDMYRRHPEIEDEQIEAPILIIGQGRSGTSHLFNLMSEDPANRSVRMWETVYPAPPPEPLNGAPDPRIAEVDALWDLARSVTPSLASVHEFKAIAPTESIHLMCLAFVGDWLPGNQGQVPSFQAFYPPFIKAGIAYERRMLKLLQWRQPKRRWLLKSPTAINYLAETMEVYPDLRLVWAHRDPVKAMDSVVGLQGTLNWLRSDLPFREGAHEIFFDSEAMGQALAAPIDMIENGQLAPDRLSNVQYVDLVSDPVATVEQVYRDLGLDFPAEARAAIERYVAMRPRNSRPAHRYNAAAPEEAQQDRSALARYQRYFNIPDEVE